MFSLKGWQPFAQRSAAKGWFAAFAIPFGCADKGCRPIRFLETIGIPISLQSLQLLLELPDTQGEILHALFHFPDECVGVVRAPDLLKVCRSVVICSVLSETAAAHLAELLLRVGDDEIEKLAPDLQIFVARIEDVLCCGRIKVHIKNRLIRIPDPRPFVDTVGPLYLEPGLEDLNVGPDGESSLATQPQQTRTFTDIQDWDPRNVYVFPGNHGKIACCHVAMKTAEQIEAEWNVVLEGKKGISKNKDARVTYEYFDEQTGWVALADGKVLKPPTPHGMGTVPVDVHTVGWLPFFQAEGKDYEANYGE
ncbi:hypothetical protein LCGC14_2908280, partial [marine sediment metagenome]